MTAEEGTQATMHERIYIAHSAVLPTSFVQELLETMRLAVLTGISSNEHIRSMLETTVKRSLVQDAVEAGD